MAARFRDEAALLASGESFPDDIFYVPFLACCSLLDFLPENALLVLDELADIADGGGGARPAGRRDPRRDDGRCELPEGLALPAEAVAGAARGADVATPASSSCRAGRAARRAKAASGCPSRPPALTAGASSTWRSDLAGASQRGETTVMVSQQAARMAEVLAEHDLFATPLSAVESPLPPGALAVVHGSLPEGWSLRRDSALADAADRRRAVRLRQAAPLHASARRPPRRLPRRPQPRRLRRPHRARHRPSSPA